MKVLAEKSENCKTRSKRILFRSCVPACYSFEPTVRKLKKALGEGCEISKSKLIFMAKLRVKERFQEDATKAMIHWACSEKEEVLGMQPIFNYIHKQTFNVTGPKDLRSIFNY